MKLKKQIKIWGLTALVVFASGCEKDFLDINVDPNNPSKVTLAQLLTTAEVSMVNSFGIGNPGMSTPASILVHQTVQRGSVDAYNVSGEDFQIQTAWQNLYSGALMDLKVIIEQGTEEEAYPYVGIAKILTAYSYSMMVDLWGDIPFSEALKGADVRFPNYDDDAAIYPQLFTLIDEGIADLEQDGVSPAGDDVIYNGSLAKWRRFAKTLKLKMYNQIRLVQDVSAEVNALVAENDMIRATGDDFELQYGSSVAPDDRNPAFVFEYTPGNKVTYISPYFYEIMTDQSNLNDVLSGVTDPRVPYYWFNQLADDDEAQNPTEYHQGDGFLSIWFASQGINQGFQQDRSQSILGLYPVGGRFDDDEGGEAGLTGAVTGPGDVAQRLLPHFSYLYILAELGLTVPGVSIDPRAYLDSAIRQSFAKVNEIAEASDAPLISNTAREAYISDVMALYDAASTEGKLELIMTEKWIASFGFALDAYTDYRRTGYPIMYDPNTDPLGFTVTSRGYPLSLAYNARALDLNDNAPEQKTVTTDRVFWDPN